MENVILGNCLDKLKDIEDNIVQLVLTDLPYGITQNKWDCEIDLTILWKELLRIGKQNAIFAFTSSQPFTSKLIYSNMDLWRHEWIWIKNRGSNFANTVREPFKEHETVQIFSRGKWIYNKQFQERTGAGIDRIKYKFYAKTKSENYREFERGPNEVQPEIRGPSSWQKFNVETGLHPTQKPVKLFEYLIKTYTNENDIVLDPCTGSGTTAIAARNLNRGYIVIEKEEQYYNVVLKRLEEPINKFFK